MFFDNIQVVHTRGAILEETHYYPFGLTMAGISSKAAGALQNKEKTFQGQRFDDELGLNWSQFKWRNHDPQIGRFIELDPLSENYVYNSTYAFSENHVTAHVELEGLEKYSIKDIQNPFVKAFISPEVTKPLSKAASDIDEAANVKVGLSSGGIGVRGKLGSAKLNMGVSGPQTSTKLTLGGTVSSEASIATIGAEGQIGNVKGGGGFTFGAVSFEDGKVTIKPFTSGAEGSASQESNGTKREISSSGEMTVGGTLGPVSLDASVNPKKAVAASKGFLEVLAIYCKEVIKEITPAMWGGNKDVTNNPNQ